MDDKNVSNMMGWNLYKIEIYREKVENKITKNKTKIKHKNFLAFFSMQREHFSLNTAPLNE